MLILYKRNPNENFVGAVLDEEEGLKFATQKNWDAVSNEELPASLVRLAKAKDFAFMCEEVFVADAWTTITGKPHLASRWVDTSKGDLQNTILRSRFVANEFANSRTAELYELPLLWKH